eukprot:g8681.t1
MKGSHARPSGRSSDSTTSAGFDFIEDSPMHTRGGDGARRPIGRGDDVGGGTHRFGVHGKPRVASLFVLLDALSVPPKPQGSSRAGPRTLGAPDSAIPSAPAVSSSAAKRRTEGTEGGGEQHQQEQQQAEISSQEQMNEVAARGIGPADGSTAPQSGSTSGSRHHQQQHHHHSQQENLAMRGGSDSLRLPPRPVLRRATHGHNRPGASPPERTQPVTFAQESKEARRLGRKGGGSSDALKGRDPHSRESHQVGVLGAGGGNASGSGSRSSNLGEGSPHPSAGPSPFQDTAAKRKSTPLGTAVASSSVTRQPGATAAATAAAAAARTAAAMGSQQPQDLPQERPARRRRVDWGGRPDSGKVGGGVGGGESSRREVRVWSATPYGGRESEGDGAGRFSSWAGSPSFAQGGRGAGGGGSGANDLEDGGGGGGVGTPNTEPQETGSHDGRAMDQINKVARSRRRVPSETDDALQWMTQGPDPAEMVDHQDSGSRWQSPTTAGGSGDVSSGGRGGDSRASKHAVLLQQEKRGTVGGSSSDLWREVHALGRCVSPPHEGIRGRRGEGQGAGGEARGSLRPLSLETSPGCAAGKEAKRAMEVADDDGSSSSSDEGDTYHDGGHQDGERGTGARDEDQARENKEMLGVRGLCLMKGTLLAMVDWSTADGGIERSIMPTSQLKARWPRQYIAYLEAKVVFAATAVGEDGRTAPDTCEGGDSG